MTIAILHAVHDISNSLTPTYISHLFTAQSSISSHSTQSSTRDDYYVKHSIKIKQTKYHVSLFQDMVSKSGKVYLVKCVTYPKINFKINVHDALLRILTEENNCIALPALITKISWKLAFLHLHFFYFKIYIIVNLISFIFALSL